MKIYEGEQILSVHSKFLKKETCGLLERLLREDHGKNHNIVQLVNEIAASLPNNYFGNIIDAIIFNDSTEHGLSVSIKQDRANVRAYKMAYKEFLRKVKVSDVYFIKKGFLALTFHDGYAVMFYIGDPKLKGFQKGSKTIPIFRDRKTGSWIGRIYIGTGEMDILNIHYLSEFGNVARKLGNYINNKLQK